METIWKNIGGFADARTILGWILNISISSQLCCVTMEMIWRNTGGFVDARTIFGWILNISICSPAMLCYYGEDMEEYRRLCRCEDNIWMDLEYFHL